MHLPFSRTEFLDVFAAYNTTFWPVIALLWLASLRVVMLLRQSRDGADRAAVVLLSLHWAWSGIAYHAVFFSSINPAAWLFAGLFVVEAALLSYEGLRRNRLRFSVGRSPRHVVAAVLLLYSLAYPLVVLAEGLTLPRAPIFGVPCPTTIFTTGVLLTTEHLPVSVIVIPVLWATLAGSSALLLGVHADLMLLICAVVLLMACARLRPSLNHSAT